MEKLLLIFALAASPGEVTDTLRQVAVGLFPDSDPSEVTVQPSALPDLYEVSLGTRVLYLTADGQHLLAGPLYSLTSQQNLTAQRQAQVRRELIAEVGEVSSIVYPAKAAGEGAATQEVTVVTNIDCTFCRRLHAQLDEYAEAGIALRYVMLPSAAPQSYQATAALLCSPDPAQAVSQVMLSQGPREETVDCPHNLNEHVDLASRLGAVSTPNLILPSGELIQGYQTPAQLAQRLQR